MHTPPPMSTLYLNSESSPWEQLGDWLWYGLCFLKWYKGKLTQMQTGKLWHIRRKKSSKQLKEYKNQTKTLRAAEASIHAGKIMGSQ